MHCASLLVLQLQFGWVTKDFVLQLHWEHMLFLKLQSLRFQLV
jgi:hypothetical protein